MYLWYAFPPFPCDRQSLCGHWKSWVAEPKYPGLKPLSITTPLNLTPFLSLVPSFSLEIQNPGHSQTFCAKSPAAPGNRWLIFKVGQLRMSCRRLWAVVCPALGWLAVLAHGHGSTQLLPGRVIEQIISGTRISSLAAGQEPQAELPWLHARLCFALLSLVL